MGPNFGEPGRIGNCTAETNLTKKEREKQGCPENIAGRFWFPRVALGTHYSTL